MSDKLITAEELLNNCRFKSGGQHLGESDFNTIIGFAKNFAKIHVEAALKEQEIKLNNFVKYGAINETWINIKKVLNAYDSKNIK